MKKLTIIPIICTVLLLMLAITPASATTFDIYPDSTTTVKEIMDDEARPGDTIFFHAGTYSYPGVLGTDILNIENITWKGEGPDLVTLSMGKLLCLDAEGTTVEGFTITTDPITVTASNCHVSNCVMKNVPGGLLTHETRNNCIVDNCVFEGITNDEGIKIRGSNTIFVNNTIKGATGEYSAITIDAEKCTITNNTITDSVGAGITLFKAVDTLITHNNILSNGYAGIELYEVTGVNTIYGNNIVNNGVTATTTGTKAPAITYWNSTKPFEYTYNGETYTGYLGNYWGTAYTGTDENNEGVGDSIYTVPESLGTDYAPLMTTSENYLVEADGDSDSSSQKITDADWASFQKDNYNRGVTAERGPITYPDSNRSWDVYAGFINTAPIVVGDKVIVSGNGLKAYNRTGGDALWTGSGGGLGNPAYGNGTVFVPANTHIYAVDLLSGKTIWKKYAGSNAAAQLNTPITYEDHRIYFGEWNGLNKYYCYYDNGTECWNRSSTSENGYYWAGAAIIGDYLVYGDDGDHLCSVNKYTGETIEDMDVSSVFGVSAKQIRSSVVYVEESEKIYFSSQGCYCFSLGFNKTDGTFDTSDKHYAYTGCSTSTPAIYNGRLYMGIGGAGSKTTPFYCLNTTDLTKIWSFTAGGGVQSSPVISTYYDDGDGEVYIYFTTNTEKGTIYCLRDYEGNTEAEEVWHYTPPKGKYQYTLGGAAISDGFVYFGNNIKWGGSDGGYFFGLTDSDPETSPQTTVANFSANVSSGEAPLTVQFTDTSTNSPTIWAWDFDSDGGVDSTEQNPSWTYTEKGSYNVSLTAENEAGNNTHAEEDFIKVTGPTVLSFNPVDTSISKGMTTEIQIVADEFPEGLSGYRLTVEIDNPDAAEITGLEFPAWANPTENSSLLGSSVYLKAVDGPINDEDEIGTIKPGDSDVVLGTLTLLGKNSGNANISITVNQMDPDNNGSEIRTSVLQGSLNVGMEAFPDPLCKNSPKDLDGDGIFEDITGNGECTFTDLQLYFHYMEWIEENRPVEAFDFNGNDRIDFNDVVLMFREIRPME